MGHPISSNNGLISQKLLLQSEFYYPLHVAMGIAYCNLSIKTRRVGFRLHTSTCVFPSINILAVNILLLVKLFQVVK